MWNIPSEETLAKIPRLYETENVALKEKLIHLHFFIGGSDWYIAEYDGKDLFWGFAILNSDYEMAEWGYVSFRELIAINSYGFEIDCELPESWNIKKAVEIDKIRISQGWVNENDPAGDISKDAVHSLRVGAEDYVELQNIFS